MYQEYDELSKLELQKILKIQYTKFISLDKLSSDGIKEMIKSTFISQGKQFEDIDDKLLKEIEDQSQGLNITRW